MAVKEFMPNDIATRVGTTVSVAMESRAEDFTYGAERFQEEARILAKFIGQPNIAGVTDYFDENDTSYFVMDYIEGISFKTYIANQGGKVSPQESPGCDDPRPAGVDGSPCGGLHPPGRDAGQHLHHERRHGEAAGLRLRPVHHRG